MVRFLNIVGLVMGMIGVLIIFRYGPPQPTFQKHVFLAVDVDDAEQRQQAIAAEERKYTTWSRVGLGLIFLGFLAQCSGHVYEWKCERTRSRQAT